jgi:predicted nucleic acid-binding protein
VTAGYLVDTNVVSELRKGNRADPGVRDWISSVADEGLFLSVLVIGELRRGIERIARRDEASAEVLDRWLAGIAGEYEDRILPVDVIVAEEWGRINVPDPLPVVDGLLAATAIVHDLTLVTRNTADITSSPAITLNPFGQ